MSTSRAERKAARIRLRGSSNGMLMTPEEFDAAIVGRDDAYRYELIRGVLIVSPRPSISERVPNEQLGHLLCTYQEIHPQGSALDLTAPEQTIELPDGRRVADRVIWAGLGRRPDPRKDVPAIVAEFVSKRRRDRVRDFEEKRREFLALGVSEYWVLDRFAHALTVFRRPPAEPAELRVEGDGEYQTPLLPGFVLPLGRLWRLGDDWEKPAP